MHFHSVTYLYALIGLLTPIVIHLWSKRENKIRKIGSIRFLPESETSQSKSLQLNEKRLLLIRCLLLALLSFLLSDVYYLSGQEKGDRLVLVDPAVLNDSRVQRALDTLDNEYIRLWTSGFPELNDQIGSDSSKHNYWDLILQAESLQGDSLLVIGTSNFSRFEGKRIATSKHIDWVDIAPLTSILYTHRVLKTPTTCYALKGKTSVDKTSYQLVQLESAKPKETKWDTLKIQLVFEKNFSRDRTYLLAALRSIERLTKRPMRIDSHTVNEYVNTIEQSMDWVFWLSEDMPAIKSNVERTLVFKENALEDLLYGSNSTFYLGQRLDRVNVLKEDLVGRLLSIIIPTAHDKNDKRLVAQGQFRPLVIDSNNNSRKASTDLNHWLWVLFILILVVERYNSFRRVL